MKKSLDIIALVDDACVPDADPEFMQEPDEAVTEYNVIGALRSLGHEVSVVGAKSVQSVVERLLERKVDLVFNLTEVFGDKRVMDKNIAALLEMMEVPFTGTGSVGLMLCRGKGLCKQMLSLHKIRVPGFVTVAPGKPTRVPKHLCYPMVVKPAYGDGSEGISNASLVTCLDALKDRVRMIHERWGEPAIAEEYIDGRELYVSIIGNSRLSVLPAREVFFNHGAGNGPVLTTYRVKWDKEYQKKWRIEFGYADLNAAEFANIERVCKRAYRVLQLRDYGRIDLRLKPDGKLIVLEVNPNPDIAYGEEVAESAEKAGIEYKDLIARILRMALRRYGRA